MCKQVILRLLDGDFKNGFDAFLQVQDETSDTLQELYQVNGKLPASADIKKFFDEWQNSFRNKVIRPSPASANPRAKVISKEKYQFHSDVKDAADALKKTMGIWLNRHDEDWQKIRDGILKTLHSDDEIRVIIQTENTMLRQLPWQGWDMFRRYYPRAEIGLSSTEAQNVSLNQKKEKGIRILAVLGQSDQIDIDFDIKILDRLGSQGADVNFFNKPTKKDLLEEFGHEAGWDIFFFAGHSESINGEIGLIHLNDNESIEIEEFKNALRTAIEKRLQIAVFNSCDGLGLANQLGKLHLPHCIVMREPVPDQVAQEFLMHFLTAFAGGSSFYSSVHEAREKLEDTWDKEYPGVNWLPVIYQNITMKPLTWRELSAERRTSEEIHPERPWKQITLIGILILMTLALTYKVAATYIGNFIFERYPEKWVEPLTNMEFIRIPEGCYDMGCDAQNDPYCAACETPLHQVCLDGFWIGTNQVLQKEWKAVMENNPSAHDDDNMQVEMVSWDDVQEFIKALEKKSGEDYRLPTEAEWEYLCKLSNSVKESDGSVIQGINNPIGEWCEDTFAEDAYSSHAADNPIVHDMSDKNKVLRGVRFGNLKKTDCTFRMGRYSESQSSSVGFRIVRMEN